MTKTINYLDEAQQGYQFVMDALDAGRSLQATTEAQFAQTAALISIAESLNSIAQSLRRPMVESPPDSK